MTKKEDISNSLQQTNIPRTPLGFIWYVSKPHKKYLWWSIVAVTIAETLGTSTPFIFKSIIDNANAVLAGTGDVSKVWFWAIAYPIAGLIIGAAWRSSGFIGMQWATRANATAYTTLFRYLSSHSHSYFSNRFAGSLSSKVSHASEGSQSTIEAFLWNYYSTILSLLITSLYLATTSIKTAVLFLSLVVLLVPLNIFLTRYRRPHVVKYSAQATKARGYAVDAITNMSAVRQFARTENEQLRFHEQINVMRLLNLKQWRLSEWSLSLNNLLIISFEGVILLYSVFQWTKAQVSVGDLVMIVALLASIQGSLIHIGSSLNSFIRRIGEIQEGLSDIIVDHEITDKPGATRLIVKAGEIIWDEVTFKYEANTVFENFNLTIKAGERMGLVGSSGAGKTTFVSLLLRQHELDKGAICVDGEDISKVTQDSLREAIAIVPQEPMLFHRSVRENIAYGNPEATLEEIVEVAKKAEAHDFITSLKDGYDTLVGERGVKLSGGQKQRIAIARAMLKNAPILILDEATSALDSESEVAIQKALHELMLGKTVIAIAHRLSTLREMDRIIVLDKGAIVEDGTHLTLSKKQKGLYARLWKHQAGGFLKE